MAYTIAEKILLFHAGKKDIKPGEFIEAGVDVALGNDITAPIAIAEFKKAGFKKVFNKNKIVLVPDHFAPAKDLRSANQCKILADFAREQGIKNYFEVGCMGIEHALLPELGLVLPGDLVIGADSHTCTYGALGCYSTGVGSTDLARAFVDGKCWLKVPATHKFVYKGKLNKWAGGKDLILFTIGKIGVDGALYKAMEFSGPVISGLGMDDRFAMSNMAIEAGARAGLIEPDEITKKYVSGFKRKSKFYKSDIDAKYEKVYEWDISKLEPQVACPHLPSNVKGVSELKNIKLDQVVIGSCTNGRISDLRIAARILKGRKIKQGLKLIIFPATQKIYLEAVKEGLAEIFVKAGGVFSTPTCGPCLGGHMGILTDGEVALATTNRNFIGRMGSPKSFVYLSNPAVAAASAIKGKNCSSTGSQMIIKGKVHKFSADINTDDIISAKYLISTDAKELGSHCMESIRPDFVSKVSPGDIIVAGKNFGCGSSREHAPLAIKGSGISAVIAKSFAAIFFRNAINIGLPFLELKNSEQINDGDILEIDLTSGIIRNLTQGETYKTQPFPAFLQEIVGEGGLIPWIKTKKEQVK